MKMVHLEHVLRVAGFIVGDDQFIIVGSQSLHGMYPDMPDEFLLSFEVDLIVKNRPARTEVLNTIGQDSDFHEMYGYYADPVDENTSRLPKGWKGRLVNLKTSGAANGVSGLCLDPHDLAISKLYARREKDIIFTREMVRRGYVYRERLISLANQTRLTDGERDHVLQYIESDFQWAEAHPLAVDPGLPIDGVGAPAPR